MSDRRKTAFVKSGSRFFMSIKTFRRVIFSESDIDVFEKNTVEVFCAVNIFRRAPGCRDERFMVLL